MGTIVFFDKAKEEIFTGGMNLSSTMNCVLLAPEFSPSGIVDIDTSDYSSSISPYALGNLSGTSVAIRNIYGIGDMTNWLKYANFIGTSPWSSTLGSATKTITDIYGNANNAYRLTDNSALATQSVFQDVTISADGNTHGTLIYIKKDSTETRFPKIVLNLSGGATTVYVEIGLNTATGYTWVDGSQGTYSYHIGQHKDVSGNIWWKLRLTATNNSLNTTLRHLIYPAWFSTEGGAADIAATGSIDVYGNQVQLDLSSIEDISGFFIETTASESTVALPIPDVTIVAGNAVSMDLSDIMFTASGAQNFSAQYACLVQSGVNTPLAYMELSTSTIVAHKIKVVWP